VDSEEWRLIQDFPKYYISSLGRVQNIATKQIRSARPNHQGFPTLVLYKGDNPTRFVRQINMLVAQAFLGPPEHRSMTSVWHKNGDFVDCRAVNLKWDSRARVMEWNDMWRSNTPKLRTPRVMVNKTGRIFANAFECGKYVGEIETAVVAHIENFPPQYADNARFKYVQD
jgi:hypothetical protein